MSDKTVYEQLIKDKEFERLMAQEDFIMGVTENFCDILQDENISRSALAELMGRTKGFISQILNGGRNLTLRTMVDVAFCLGYTIELKLVKRVRYRQKDTFRVAWHVNDQKDCAYLERSTTSDDYAPASCDLSGARVAA